LTSVHVAAAWGNYEFLKLLLLNGGDIGARDDDNQTPLNLAEQENHAECVDLLKSWRQNDSPEKQGKKSSLGGASVAFTDLTSPTSRVYRWFLK